jgi:uncharacterized protein YoxC
MNKWMSMGLALILVIATVTNGVLYFQTSSDLDDAQAQIAALQSGQSSFDDDLSAVEGSVSSLQGDMSGLQNDVSGVQGQVSGLEQDLSGIQGDISGLTNNYTALDNSFSSLEDYVSSVSTQVDSLGDTVDSIEESIVDWPEVADEIGPSIVMIETDLGVGTGVIITDDGWVLTARHVIEGGQSFTITAADGEEYNGVDAHVHESADIALIKIESDKTDFIAATIGSSSSAKVETGVVVSYPWARWRSVLLHA